jgi:hypothetical protein
LADMAFPNAKSLISRGQSNDMGLILDSSDIFHKRHGEK